MLNIEILVDPEILNDYQQTLVLSQYVIISIIFFIEKSDLVTFAYCNSNGKRLFFSTFSPK